MIAQGWVQKMASILIGSNLPTYNTACHREWNRRHQQLGRASVFPPECHLPLQSSLFCPEEWCACRDGNKELGRWLWLHIRATSLSIMGHRTSTYGADPVHHCNNPAVRCCSGKALLCIAASDLHIWSLQKLMQGGNFPPPPKQSVHRVFLGWCLAWISAQTGFEERRLGCWFRHGHTWDVWDGCAVVPWAAVWRLQLCIV